MGLIDPGINLFAAIMKPILIVFTSFILCSFQYQPTLKGTWTYAGDVFNGKKEGAPKEYALRRKYDGAHYEAFVVQKGYKDEKYETGNYTLKGDTCIDTETFSLQPSKIINKPIHYFYAVRNDTLVLKGVLPFGKPVEEYWKRVR